MTEFVVLIPARLDSSRLPGKALADIHGKPMVVRVAEQAAKSKAERVVVATDHPDIQTACQAHGVEVVMTSSQHESGTTRLAEAANTLKLPQHLIVVNVQGDEPLIDPELINRTAEVLVENNVQMATAAHELHDFDEFMNPNVVKVILDKNRNAIYFSRAPIPYPRDVMRAEKRELPSETAVCAISAFMPIVQVSCNAIPKWKFLLWKPLNRWNNCASCGTVIRLPLKLPKKRQPPAWIRRKIWTG